MPLRHVSSGNADRQRAFLRALARLTFVLGLFFVVLNFWKGDRQLALLEGLLVFLAACILILFKNDELIDWVKWGFLTAFLSVVLFAMITAPSPSVFIWALLVLPVGHRLLGLWAGSIVSLAFLATAGGVLIARYGIHQIIEQPFPAADFSGFALVLFFSSLAHERDLQKVDHELRERADLDSMTQLATRARFHELFELARKEARRDRSDNRHNRVAMIVIDLDHFKQINDTYGHAAGDHVLVAVSRRLLSRCRDRDMLGRVGGEELAIMLLGMSDEEAVGQAERLRLCIADSPIETPTATIPVTASIGVATGELATISFVALFDQADKRLYAAKQAGRNRVQSAPPGFANDPSSAVSG